MVIIDSYSRWPEVLFTKSANSDFTIQALRKTFSREGVPQVLVTDNGSHFTAEKVTSWLKGVGCRHLLTAPRHPQSNGSAENFVRTLKSAINSINALNFHELERGVDNFLMQYRNAAHAVTRESPAKLFKSRILRTNLRCLESAEVTYQRGNDLRPATGIVLNQIGNRMVKILDMKDGSVHRRHVDQIRYNIQDDQNENSTVSNPSENVPEIDHMTISPTQPVLRRSERIANQPQRDYKDPQLHSSCGGCAGCA
jgi:hypothetical protein